MIKNIVGVLIILILSVSLGGCMTLSQVIDGVKHDFGLGESTSKPSKPKFVTTKIESSGETESVRTNKAKYVLPSAKGLSWEYLLHASMKMSNQFDYSEIVDAYMSEFRWNTWKKYRNDEFELSDKRKDTILMMKKRANSFNKNDFHVINTSFKFSNYDFKRKLFPLNSLSESSEYYYDKYQSGKLPRRFTIKFSNAKIIGDIHMDKVNAQKFITVRKQDGYVNREVYAKLFFKIKSLADGDRDFVAVLDSAYIYSDEAKRTLLHKYK